MTPFEQARAVYSQERCVNTFEYDFCCHLLNGCIFCTPDAFIMGRAVDRHAPEDLILEPAHEFRNPNAWLVWLAAGNMGCLPMFTPYPLPWVGWQRDNRLRWYRSSSLVPRVTARGILRVLPPSVGTVRRTGQGAVSCYPSTATAAAVTYSSGGQCRETYARGQAA